MNSGIFAGSGRSGTTWVQDCVAQANNMRTPFEPLLPVRVAAAKNLAYKYRDEVTHDPILRAFMDEVVSGFQSFLWVNYRVRSGKLDPFQSGPANEIENVRKLMKIIPIIEALTKMVSLSSLSGQI